MFARVVTRRRDATASAGTHSSETRRCAATRPGVTRRRGGIRSACHSD